MKTFYVYILASQKNGTLYIGVTSNLEQRMFQHQHNEIDGFTKKYDVHHLVYYESTFDAHSAFLRETQLKRWKREWKIRLIEEQNPSWKDLFNPDSGFLPSQE